jgi:hypothetical protein
VRTKCITSAVKYPQVAGHCGCEMQSDSLSAGVAVEDSDDDDDDDNDSCVRDNFVYSP